MQGRPRQDRRNPLASLAIPKWWNRAALRDEGRSRDKMRNMREKLTAFAGLEAAKTAPRAASIRIFPRKTGASA